MAGGREFIPNQVFVGLPWKNARPRYEAVIRQLEKKFPLYFTIVGRDDAQDAEDLFEVIKTRISSSSYGIFDATGGNANVSLEYGFAEGIGVQRAIFLSTHRAAQKNQASPIISDLGGRRRIQYKNERSLSVELHKFSREHPYTVRFEKSLVSALKNKAKGTKKRGRALAIKLIRLLDGEPSVRRAELIQRLQSMNYKATEVDEILRKLHASGVINISVGRESKVRVA